ncbi:unnamed protein product [Rotaria magnacalcarata]|uniref:SAM domain-containing protein n=1 Tax=Rotaria magnacalcarata TaxID=392030 RepID=A0A8S2P4J8_9BILA|nr:unnamed protein product [Rotaria magnacalcarata]
MGNYLSAMSSYKKALEIREKVLPKNHPDLAASYNNLGVVHTQLNELESARQYYLKVLNIYEERNVTNHPNLAASCNNLALVHEKLDEHSKALEYFERAHNMYAVTLPPEHLRLAITCDNVGTSLENMGEHTKSLQFHEKAITIRRKALPSDHPDLAASYKIVNMTHWTVSEVSGWLELNGFQKYMQVFEDEDIDGVAMMEPTDQDVEQLLSVKQPGGTTKKPTIGAKKRFEAKLNEWKKEQKAKIAVSCNSDKNRSVLVLK